MKLLKLAEMAKAITPKHCGKCNQLIPDRNYYFYKGQYFHKGGCPAAGASPSSTTPSATPADPSAPVAAPSAPRVSTPKASTTKAADPKAAISAWLYKHGVENYTIDEATGEVNVTGNVRMDIEHATELPVQFGTVTGDFSVGGSVLTTLKGCPHTVGRSFNCAHTDITSFEHGPTTVGRAYLAHDISTLTSLKGLPSTVPGMLDLSGPSSVGTLEGISERIGTLHLPDGGFSAHNIHKMVKFIRSYIEFHDASKSTHWLGALFIEGLRDGVKCDNSRKVQDLMNEVIDRREDKKQQDPDNPALPYRDVLGVQEKLIDAGFSKIAKL